MPEDTPWAVRSYHNSHPFPCDPTLDQLYNADRFEASALGSAATAALEYGPHQDRS